MDKYFFRIIHNKILICGRMTGWGTRNPRRGLKLSRLVSSRMVLIQQAGLGCCMMLVRRWALSLLSNESKAVFVFLAEC